MSGYKEEFSGPGSEGELQQQADRGSTLRRPVSKSGGHDWSELGGLSESSQIEAKLGALKSHIHRWPPAATWEEVKPGVRQLPGDQGQHPARDTV